MHQMVHIIEYIVGRARLVIIFKKCAPPLVTTRAAILKRRLQPELQNVVDVTDIFGPKTGKLSILLEVKADYSVISDILQLFPQLGLVS